jgi:hypothetical protein
MSESHKKPRQEKGEKSDEWDDLFVPSSRYYELEQKYQELQSFTQELLSSSRSSEKGSSYKSFLDPLVNLEIEILRENCRAAGASEKTDVKNMPDLMIRKLTAEVDSLKKAACVGADLEKKVAKKDAMINQLKLEMVQARLWIDDLSEKNNELESQVYLLECQALTQKQVKEEAES